MTADAQKKQAAYAALDLIEDGMTVGLGTGSTAAYFVRGLAEAGRDVKGVPTSEATAELARACGVELADIDEATVIDVTVDGADEADRTFRLIKGGGGALLREKIVAAASRRMAVIADASKLKAELGAFPLPVEVTPYAFALTVAAVRRTFETHGFTDADIAMRMGEGGPFLSDGGNYIFDCALGRIGSPEALADDLLHIPGVVETGLFIDLATDLFIAAPDGVEHFQKPTA
ncbi:MAG: ribose-5-phosphate isomerase RpiA [Pseudomonadota bacterium]